MVGLYGEGTARTRVPVMAGLSLVLRIGLPSFGALLGSSQEECVDGFACTGGAHTIVGAFIGYLSAVALDATALGFERVPLRPSVLPALDASRDRVWLGVTGEF